MRFIQLAADFFDKKNNNRVEAEKIFKDFDNENLDLGTATSALHYLKEFPRKFGFFIKSKKIIPQIVRIVNDPNARPTDVSGIFYELSECGFSSKHFSAEQRTALVKCAVDKISNSNPSNSREPSYLLATQIAILSGLKNLGLLEGVSAQELAAIKKQLNIISQSPHLLKLQPETKGALVDFAKYGEEVLEIKSPDLGRIKANLPTPGKDISPLEYRFFKVLKKYLAKGSGQEDEWVHDRRHKLDATEDEETRYSIGPIEIALESRVLNGRRYADIVVTDKSKTPPSRQAFEFDGEHHFALIDEERLPNGKTLARNKMILRESGKEPVVIESRDFRNLSSADELEFLAQIPQIRELRSMLAHVYDENPEDKFLLKRDVQAQEIERNKVVQNKNEERQKEDVEIEKLPENEPEDKTPVQAQRLEVAANEVRDEEKEAAGKPKKKKPKKKNKADKEDKEGPEQQGEVKTIEEMLQAHSEKRITSHEFERYLSQFDHAQTTLTYDMFATAYKSRDINGLVIVRKFCAKIDPEIAPYFAKANLSGYDYLFNAIIFGDLSQQQPIPKAKEHLATYKKKRDQLLSGVKEGRELAEFYYDFHTIDSKEALKAAIRKGEAGIDIMRMAFLSPQTRLYLKSAISEIFQQKSRIDVDMASYLFDELISRDWSEEVATLHWLICSHSYIYGDLEYLAFGMQHIHRLNPPIGDDSMRSLARNVISTCDNVAILKFVIAQGGDIFIDEASASKSVIRAIIHAQPNILEFILQNCEQRFGKGNFISEEALKENYKYAIYSPEIVNCLIKHGLELPRECLVECFVMASAYNSIELMRLFYERYTDAFSEEVRGQIITELSDKEISRVMNKHSKKFIDDFIKPQKEFDAAIENDSGNETRESRQSDSSSSVESLGDSAKSPSPEIKRKDSLRLKSSDNAQGVVHSTST